MFITISAMVTNCWDNDSQPAIICSKLKIETLEEVVKYVQVNNKDIRTTPLASFGNLYCKLWTYFTPCSSVSIVKFEQVNAGWEKHSSFYI